MGMRLASAVNLFVPAAPATGPLVAGLGLILPKEDGQNVEKEPSSGSWKEGSRWLTAPNVREYVESRSPKQTKGVSDEARHRVAYIEWFTETLIVVLACTFN